MGCKHPLNRVIFADGFAKVCGEHLQGGDIAALMAQYGSISKIQPIPCGQCIGCRMEYSRQWATRCELEMREWEHNWFLTLTYDDEHLPRKQGVTELGELIDSNYLKPDDVRKFMNSLRKRWLREYEEDNIRFYGCGEYGEQGERAHYHIMLFNCNIRDLEMHHKNKHGNPIYTSEMISHVWGKGIVGICEANWETAAYTARYMLKKQKGEKAAEYYESRGQTPEFCRMSRMPGIGQHWYEEHKDKMWELDEITLAKGRKIRPPKYYDELYDKEIEKLYSETAHATNEEDCTIHLKQMLSDKADRKAKRETAAIAAANLKRANTTLSITDQLKIEEEKLKSNDKKGSRIL